MATDVPKAHKGEEPTKEDKAAREAKKNAAVNPQEVPKFRRRFLMVNPQDFLQLFTKGLVLSKRMSVFTGVPADAMIVSMTVDHVRGGIMLLCQSDEYEEIPATDMPPVQMVEIELGVKDATKKARSTRKK
jgi:hypothetical protein